MNINHDPDLPSDEDENRFTSAYSWYVTSKNYFTNYLRNVSQRTAQQEQTANPFRVEQGFVVKANLLLK